MDLPSGIVSGEEDDHHDDDDEQDQDEDNGNHRCLRLPVPP